MHRHTILVLLLVAAVAAADQPPDDKKAAQAIEQIRTGITQARTSIDHKEWAAAQLAIDRSRLSLATSLSFLKPDEFKKLNAEIDQVADDVRVLTDHSVPEATRLKYYEATLRLRKRQDTTRPAGSPANKGSTGPQSTSELTSVLAQFVDAANEAIAAAEGRDAKLDACFGRILNHPVRLAAKTLGVTTKMPVGDTGLFGDRPNRALVVSMPVTWPVKATSQPTVSKPDGVNIELATAVEIYLSAPDAVVDVTKTGDELRGRIVLTRGEIIPSKRSVPGGEAIYAGMIRFLGDFQPDDMPQPLAVNPTATMPTVPPPDPMQPIVRSVSKIKKVVFVCDASGSMLQKFDAVKHELSRTIHQLHPDQSFNVIFFQERICKSLDPKLLIATPGAMRQADLFFETIIPRADTDPLPALELAFRQKPDLIYLLTDGDFPDNNAVLRLIQQLDKDGKVKINTIAFVNEKDKDTDFMALLQKIAKDTGGVYKYVRENSL